MLEPRRYAEWLHEDVFLPVVVVIGTEAVRRRVREMNGLSLAELFSPFGGSYRRIPASCQSLERVARVEALRVRFADSDIAFQISATAADQADATAVDRAAPRDLRPSGDGARAARRLPSPWYLQWRSALVRSLRWSDHEGLDQPAAALLVISSKESDPMLTLEQLLHSSNMPPLCSQGVLDPEPARAAAILHDLADPESPSLEALSAMFDRVKARFAPHQVVVLKIHHGREAATEVQDTFRPFVEARGTPPPPQAGTLDGDAFCRHLSQEDMEILAKGMSDVILKGAVPWMEQQLQHLEAQISQNRKGLRNQLKYFWRKPRESVNSTQPALLSASVGSADGQHDSGTVYTLQTVEGQMRLAGDIAFYLRDYEAAQGYYRSVVSDFKQDKSWKQVGGSYEMWGVCSYILGLPRNEWERCMESAYDNYLRAGVGRHAMRAVALHQAMICDCKESAGRLMKVNVDMADAGLRSALVLEQSAQLYFEAGSERKGAFHMVLAGHTFNKLGFKRLALCGYRAVADGYGEKWFHVMDHFNFTMGRQAFGLGMLHESLWHFLALINSFASSDKRVSINADREATYLKEFQFVVKNWVDKCKPTAKEQRLDLQIPRIGKDIVMLLGDEHLKADAVAPPPMLGSSKPPPPPPPPPVAIAVPSSMVRPGVALASRSDADVSLASAPASWESLGEKALRPSGSGSLTQDDRLELQWLDRRGDRIFDSLQRTTAVGADVSVEFELSNPLRVTLELSDLRLVGELVEAVPESVAEDARDIDTKVVFAPQRVSLAPLETRRIRLVATPTRVGLLRIHGVSWNLMDSILCERPLVVKGRRLRATLKQRSSLEGVYSTDKRLELRVCATMPHLQARLEGWPEFCSTPLFHGEIRKLELVLTGCAGNGSGLDASRVLRIATSHPSCLALRADAKCSECSEAPMRQEADVIICDRSLDNANSDEVRVPLLLRADSPGEHTVRLCLLAESAEANGYPKSEHRQWLTIEAGLSVKRLAACSASISPSFRETWRFIVACSMENRGTAPVVIRRVRLVSRNTRHEQLLEDSAKPEDGHQHRVAPGQVVNMLLASRREEESTDVYNRCVDEGIKQNSKTGSGSFSFDGYQAARRRLFEAVQTPGARPPSAAGTAAASVPSTDVDPQFDLAIEWVVHQKDAAGGELPAAEGEVYVFGVQRDRGSAPPCPLEMRLLAPDTVSPCAASCVPVTLRVQNTALVGDVSFYVVADPVQDFIWLGCERSATVRLVAGASYTSTLHACFPFPGVFNLNRLRFFVVGMMSPVPGTPPASEHAPLAFSFPFERLVHVCSAQKVVEDNDGSGACGRFSV
eukprot:TRINITY_DN13337_c0_g1_i2.p1 TRINITY_DN13337_c0_g1~~TRINITY_DN13337_c0_g1_i2.p1  ORF type:complete len:1325 (-),score=203.88 TRINITY_DN13337_c0_g1_i2:467-4441(-)